MSFTLDPSVEEEYQKLRGNLFARPGKDGLRTVMLVGSSHGEGVTTTCTILASVLARAGVGEVVLIDANLRSPSCHDLFTASGSTKGLTDLLTGGVRSKDLVWPTSIPNLSVIKSGRPLLQSPSHLYQGQLVELLVQLREEFRYTILDCAPVKDYSDSSFLAPNVDGIVLVIRAERTRIETAIKTKRQLEWAGGQVIGAVLNSKKNHIPMVIERLL
ncbi:Protein-tyrosine kinase [Candidatus Methylomirabilis lanthanidiphila]|uniref:Protein-tyrosine kinase n=1 Tax=Candidatus Methylomirabilis lanthanidiphila TaxID=2211376 RepID=A0A564ZIB6_9BACT|nr:CpsD/CapB family tyrosine-protein kinase [Candidatus Methylomirabilis lanthanidiphila]VUZ84846.1 Protein-tyrosine kinase [Candidatus Methylomirabilis lanthanidiphila]